ncbi:MAG: hypothetical protein AMJ81_00470 [Phycisphaerae bacterium SM23_33]|nr:MAG: hypothetical protein AMJ81_00470 [Phycisphaerae bacterium SM23_33]
MLAIKNNLMAENAARHLGKSYDALAKSVERLSSGLRINSAKDDAAGLAVRELVRADIAVLRQGARNARDAVSMLQTAEGAMAVIDEILVRMRELAEQASTESYSGPQRSIMNYEFGQMAAEIDRIAKNTAFNEMKLLDEETETLQIHIGTQEMIDIVSDDMTAAGLAIGATKATGTYETWVADPDADWVTVTASGLLNITFADQEAIPDDYLIDVTFDSTFGGDGAYTMQEAADAINARSRAVRGYDAATVVQDNATGMYTIHIQAEEGGIWNITIAGDGALAAGSTIETAGNWNTANGSGTAVSIATAQSARTALDLVADAIKIKDGYRAQLGYLMNRLEAATSVIDIQAENLLAAESRISDVDVATETAALTRNQVLAQAGISMLGQANVMPQMALNLLG